MGITKDNQICIEKTHINPITIHIGGDNIAIIRKIQNRMEAIEVVKHKKEEVWALIKVDQVAAIHIVEVSTMAQEALELEEIIEEVTMVLKDILISETRQMANMEVIEEDSKHPVVDIKTNIKDLTLVLRLKTVPLRSRETTLTFHMGSKRMLPITINPRAKGMVVME